MRDNCQVLKIHFHMFKEKKDRTICLCCIANIILVRVCFWTYLKFYIASLIKFVTVNIVKSVDY